MKVVSLVAQKGGAGKTTIAVHLAVLAQQQGQRVALIDIDPQRSTAAWWQSRQVDTPLLVETAAAQLPAVIQAAQSDKLDLVIIDTPPRSASEAASAVAVSSLVLIPTRPAILDLRAISMTVDLIGTTNQAAAIVLNACPPGRLGEAAIVTEARAGLNDYGLPVVPVALTHRVAFSYALIDGEAVTEFEPHGKAAREIRVLSHWIEETLQ